MLAVYDPLILGSANHLDVGVGTGYFLDRCRFPTGTPRLALMDLNEDCLAAAARSTARDQPQTYVANVLKPITAQVGEGIAPFDSIGLTYLLHCAPGDNEAKSVAFEHLGALAKPGARVFGATILSGGVPRNWYARQVMAFNNRRGIFSNKGDDLESLHKAVAAHLDDPEIRTVGCVALFAGRV